MLGIFALNFYPLVSLKIKLWQLDIIRYNGLILYWDVSVLYLTTKGKYIDRKISVFPVTPQPITASQNTVIPLKHFSQCNMHLVHTLPHYVTDGGN